jgi:hypothetical protein
VTIRRCWLGLLLLTGWVSGAAAQQYRLRLESSLQSVSFRGVSLDSVPAAETVLLPGGARETTDGFAVRCGIADAFCFFFRPGSVQSARPSVTSAAATIWGLGLTGLSIRVDGRLALDMGDADTWPGTEPALQLLEGYAEYSIAAVTARLGRQVHTSRLGFAGFDGGRASGRLFKGRVEVDGYLGWGLGRGSALPVTSEALNPLDDFQPRRRQIIAGAEVSFNHTIVSAWLDYQREVDPRSDYFVSERASLAGTLRLPSRFALDLGTEYDLALAEWGSADATLRYSSRAVTASAGYQRYQPHFDLWTIWGAFSPVGYSGINGAVTVRPLGSLSIRARASRFWSEDTDTETPLVSVEDRGWQVSLGASYAVGPRLSLSADHSTEFGPGASYTSLSGSATYLPTSSVTLSVYGGRLNRPLEFRFDEATLYHAGMDGVWRISQRWEGRLSAARFFEKRDRPDAGAFDWGQTRISARVSVYLGGDADQSALPPALPPARAPVNP